MRNKMALDALTAIVEANERMHNGSAVKSWNGFQNGDGEDAGTRFQSALDNARAAIAALQHDEGAALAHFEERFNEIEAGDGDIPLPQPRDGARWDEYVQRHQSALTGWELRREYEQLQRSVATAWDRFQKEMAAPVVQAGELTLQEVLETLKNFRLSNWTDDMGDGLPLVDRVTSGGTIGPGIEQLELLADEICVLFADRASSGATTAQAVRMLTPEEPEKCYSLDEETFYDLGDLIDMLDEEQAKPGILVYEGESVRHKASHYARGAVANLFERMGEQAFDDAGEHIGDWPDHAVKDDNSAELEKLIYDWLDANVKVHFYTVKNVRQIALTADMLGDDNAGRAIPADGKIGGV